MTNQLFACSAGTVYREEDRRCPECRGISSKTASRALCNARLEKALVEMARTDSGIESKPGLPESTRLMVLLLAALDGRSATPDDISLWLGSTPGRTRACIALAIKRGWVASKEQGVVVLTAGRQMLTRAPSD